MTDRNTDRCRVCGSDSLYSTHVDEEGYAIPSTISNADADGARYATFCNDCGTDQ